MNKKLLLKVLAAVLLVAGAVGGVMIRDYVEAGKPTLVGRCFLSTTRPIGLMFPRELEGMTDKEGNPVRAYLAVALVGPVTIPQALEIRTTNVGVAKDLKDGKLREVNCVTGLPVSED